MFRRKLIQDTDYLFAFIFSKVGQDFSTKVSYHTTDRQKNYTKKNIKYVFNLKKSLEAFK